MIGQIVSHYEIVEPLGAGGMGVVYKAKDTKLERYVALKFLPPQVALSEEIKLRFLNEARAASALDHTNICTVHEIDTTDDGQLFIVMAYYEGESLRDRIVRGPLPPREVVDLALQLAEGLALAHEHGILHRDIKPANVLVTTRGEVKILDFGLAKMTGTVKITRTGASMGTLNYMPPEQLQGEIVDQRADIWALGAVIYEMITGRCAFGGDNEGAVVYAILHDEPEAPTSVVPGIPSAFDRIVRRAMAKDADGRYTSLASLREDLEVVQEESRRSEVPSAEVAGEDQPTLLFEESRIPVSEAADSEPDRKIENAIAVVDFTNIATDPSASWLSVGIAETISVDLKKVASLKVIDRHKVQQVLGTGGASSLSEERLQEAGRQLGARWLFWGGYQKLGDLIRITAQCLDVEEGRTTDTLKIDGAMEKIFALQDQIIAQLMNALDLEVSDSEMREIARPETLDLEAYELCARGRQLAYRMDPDSLEKAYRLLEKAIDSDPEYAFAYSVLGQLQCSRFIANTQKSDLEQAIASLKRAVALDGGLGEAHAWLTYAYSRQGLHSEAIASGRRAVELEPDNAMAQYMLGGALWLRGQIEFATAGYSEAAGHLKRVTELAPQYPAGHQILGVVYYSCGQYERAREHLLRAARIEESGEYELGRFVGAIGLLGRVAQRQNKLDEAEAFVSRAFKVSGDSGHLYAPACNSLAHCVRGDILSWRRRWDEALRSYRLAGQQVEASPRSLGIGWPMIRANLGLARSFQSLGMRREAEQSLSKALALFGSRQGHDFNGLWDGGEAEIWLELAVYHASGRSFDKALEAVARAVDCGWRETPRLRVEPSFKPLHEDSSFQQLEAGVASLAPIP